MKTNTYSFHKMLLIICSLFWLSAGQAQNEAQIFLQHNSYPGAQVLTKTDFIGIGDDIILHDAIGAPLDTIVVHVELQNDYNFLGFQFDVVLPSGFSYVPNSLSLNPARTTNHIINGGILPGTFVLRAIAFSLTNSYFLGNSGVVASFSLIAPSEPGTHILIIQNALVGTHKSSRMPHYPNPYPGAVTVGSGFTLSGDANCDGNVNVIDVVTTVSYILANNPQPFCLANADLNGDGSINAIDVIGTIHIILGSNSFECGTSLVSDFDGNIYYTVLIGNRCWMKENLKTTHYRNGTPIEYPASNNNAWENNTTGAYAWYNNDISWKDIFGAYYNWHALNNANGLCPEGWHVPTEIQWTQLTNFITGSTLAGANRLKSCRQINSPLGGDCNTTEHPRWEADSVNYGTDDYGFAALPGGLRRNSGGFGYSNSGFYWTATTSSTTNSFSRGINYKYNTIYRSINSNKASGYSVRCVRY